MLLYNSSGAEEYPDYSQLFIDLNLKYKGFSFVFEYADAFASGLNNIYSDPNGFNILQPEQISELDVVKKYYGYSNEKARQILTLLSTDHINELKNKVAQGGRK